jgi:Tol biopolymer transport system component
MEIRPLHASSALVALGALGVAAPSASVAVQSYRLSGPELSSPSSPLEHVRTTTDGSRVVYSARNVSGVYSVSSAGGERPIRLARAISYVAGLEITPDGRRVVYEADENTRDLFELFSAPIRGGSPSVELSTPALGDVGRFAITPDSGHVVFTAPSGAPRVHSVPSDGSGPLLLLDASREAWDFAISSDGSRVVYRTNHYDGSPGNLYSVPLDGSQAPVKLNDPGDAMFDFVIVPSSDRVVYSMLLGGARKLFSTPIDGSSPPLQLDGAGGDVCRGFQLTPDGLSVVYKADEDVNEVFELYLVPVDGSLAAIRVSAPLVAGGDVQPGDLYRLEQSLFRISPDGSRAVYLADEDSNEVLELYSVPLDGSRASVKLNDPLAAGGDVQFGSNPEYLPPLMDITGDGRVVYVADRDTDEVFELYSVPIDGSSPPVELNDSLGDAIYRDVFDFRLTPDGQHVLYRANEDFVWFTDLMVVPVDGSGRARALDAPAVVGGLQVQENYLTTPRSDLALYQSDEDHDGLLELRAASLEKLRRAR